MNVLAKQVNDYLKKEFDLNFEYHDEEGEFVFSIDMDCVCLKVKILCREEDKQVLLFAYLPVKIQKSQYASVLRFINKIHMLNYDPICLLINEDCDKLMAQSVLNVGDDFSIDREVFRYAFCPLLNVLDNNFVELMKVLPIENKEQMSGDEISKLISLSKQNDSESQYQLALKYYKGKGVEQDFEQAIELLRTSLSSGREATADTLRECVEDLSQRMKKASDAQDYEKAAYFQSLIGKCGDILKVL